MNFFDDEGLEFMTIKKKYTVHIVLGTHWDREWRYSYEVTRQKLVELLDGVFDLLSNSKEFLSFTLDGQYVAIKDYLDLRPEKRELIKKLIAEKRLEIGPWYVLPDMPTLIGESIIRNLYYGIIKSLELGGVLMEGFTCSSWGQISQMPQLCNQFGLDTYSSYHGVPGHLLPVEFLWEGPDKSKVLFIRSPKTTKTVLWRALKAALNGNESDSPIKNNSELLNGIYRFASDDSNQYTSYWGEDKNIDIDYELLYKIYRNFRDEMVGETDSNQIFIGDFQDMTHLHPQIYGIIQEIKKRDNTDDNILISSVSNYFNSVKESVRHKQLKTYKGEMFWPAKENNVFRLCSILSSRIYLKQKNRETEILLTKYVEPFETFAYYLGKFYEKECIDQLWEKILLNQSHDNIGGCSVDIVHNDMEFRYSNIL